MSSCKAESKLQSLKAIHNPGACSTKRTRRCKAESKLQSLKAIHNRVTVTAMVSAAVKLNQNYKV